LLRTTTPAVFDVFSLLYSVSRVTLQVWTKCRPTQLTKTSYLFNQYCTSLWGFVTGSNILHHCFYNILTLFFSVLATPCAFLFHIFGTNIIIYNSGTNIILCLFHFFDRRLRTLEQIYINLQLCIFQIFSVDRRTPVILIVPTTDWAVFRKVSC